MKGSALWYVCIAINVRDQKAVVVQDVLACRVVEIVLLKDAPAEVVVVCCRKQADRPRVAAAISTSSADFLNVGVHAIGQADVDDGVNVANVHAHGQDVGRGQAAPWLAAQPRDIVGGRALVHGAGRDGADVHAMVLERVDHGMGGRDGLAEDQRLAAPDDVQEYLELLAPVVRLC